MKEVHRPLMHQTTLLAARLCLRFPTVLASLALLPCAGLAQAAGSPIPHGTVELVAEHQWVAPGHEFCLGLHFQLDQGWHIYWVNPGDSGEPPHVTWQLPPGLTAQEIDWPAPRRLGTSSIVDFGYEEGVMLIVPIHADANMAAPRPVQITANLKVLVCRETCIPGKAQLSLALPVKPQQPISDARALDLFAATRKSLPRPAPPSWRFSVGDAGGYFVLSARLGHQITQAAFFPRVESQIDNAAPQKLTPVAGGFQLTLRKSDQLLKPIERLKGVLVLPAGAYLVDAIVDKPAATRNGYGTGIRLPQPSKEETQR